MKIVEKNRLDKFLVTGFPDRTRAFLQKLIKGGHVLVNNKAATKVGMPLKVGDDVQVEIPEPQKIEAKAENIDLDILFEDKDIIVINKPAYMVVHPSESGSHSTGTLVNALLHHCKGELAGISGEMRPGIVHRLDKNTSGVLVVAKTDLAHQSLVKQFADRTVAKRYVALVNGRIKLDHAIIDSPIGRSLRNRKKMAISSEDEGRNAVTEYWVRKVYKDDFGEYSLVDIDLKTGRTHQIRVHMNAIGYPVVGDITYGNPKVNVHFLEKYGLDRQFLHAERLEITHPRTGKRVAFESKLPDELRTVVASLKDSEAL
ncbi:MAG: RluA family pseudouridine synthase [Candidatus Gracilibacteria bacterium]